MSVRTQQILVVCYGNICRSPMAEALFQREFARRSLGAAYTVRSAGVGAVEGQPAAALAQQVAAENGLALEAHRARRLTVPMAQAADVLIALDEFVEDCILRLAGDIPVEAWHVRDPYGGPAEDYRSSFAALQDLVLAFVAARHPEGEESR